MSTPEDNMKYAKTGNRYYTDTPAATVKRAAEKVEEFSTDLNTKLQYLIQLVEENKYTWYPFAMLALATVPVIIVLCQHAIGNMIKAFVIIIYALMLAMTLFLFRK
ncbi:unnamed protein product [Macrosiphum euphorbiae]|uniref:Uncharacterized protein n=1 Tax=Macrosiphum euphorbiae TaxID=13131 RepID=A0AAV0Y1Q5_9HEMI|nr:unnamed protein product [Macrosiphum euphorbiae]